ncbi:MAG: GNAT family N-acetyltransferase [Anaerolineae bacterium]
MIFELDKSRYDLVRPLFAGLRYNLVIDSVLDGNTIGQVYVDDLAAPGAVLLWNRQDALLLAGAALDSAFNHELGELITEIIVPDARSRYIPELSLFYQPEAWEDKIDVILPGLQLHKAKRRLYVLDKLKIDWRPALPPGHEMRRMDGVLLSSNRLDNLHQVLGWVRSFWPTHQAFVENGFGYCLVHEGTIVSWCLSVYNSGDDYELGLATAIDYRRRGYATLVAAACIEHCKTQNWTPHWHCWDANIGSIRVAERVGFKDAMHYTVYRFEI